MEAPSTVYIVAVFLTLAVIADVTWAQTNQIAGIQTAGWSRQGPLPWGFVTYDVITQPFFVNPPLTLNFEGQRAKRETEGLRTMPGSRAKRHMMGGMYPYGMGGMGGGYPYGMGGMGGGYPYGMGGGYPRGMYGMGGMGGMGMGGSGSSAQASASSHSSSGGMGYGGMGYPYY